MKETAGVLRHEMRTRVERFYHTRVSISRGGQVSGSWLCMYLFVFEHRSLHKM